MTLGELLASAGVSHLVTVFGTRLPRAAMGSAGVQLVPAPDETCARLLATASAELGHGIGACWDGAVLTLLSGVAAQASGTGPQAPPATPGDVLRAAEAIRRAGAGEVRLRPDFALDVPLPPGEPHRPARSFSLTDSSAPAAPASPEDPFSPEDPLSRFGREPRALIGQLAGRDDAPLTPARAAADLAGALPPDGIVVAEPGPVGLWVSQVMGPAAGKVRVLRGGGEVALAGALLACRQGRPGVAVVGSPPVGPAATVLHLASALDVGLVVEVWGHRGGLRSGADHRERLAAALRGPGVRVIEVPVDFTSTKLLVDALAERHSAPGPDGPDGPPRV
ncbi:hypothetical protein CC117_18375 [Parafrankia colletiae]|uniref:Uncharacterized protein n=1 Tax=Parafrankia colletiae TaxID=573497 RepID=A0A1S1QR31_9ACTN|nr:hypothetical protein [Parafrankia colletiae]MCK9904534.1 hypothetical protein [Frankia sp. Cpl3]OHV36157.1 hypothetical protein CC117_18375 [Parafrankia colletiae]